MADPNDGLILYLPLTEPLTSGPIDRSPKTHTVGVIGSPRLIADPLLGAAHQFSKGDAIRVSDLAEFPNSARPFTLQAWVRRNQNSGPAVLLAFGPDPDHPIATLYSEANGDCSLRIDTQTVLMNYPDCLTAGKWTHIALVNDGQGWSIYENGTLRKEGSARVKFFPFKFQLFALLTDSALFGLAQVRVHNRALTAEELTAQFTADMTLRTAYTESHPVVLSLLDADESATIYITDHPSGEPLTLELSNAGQRAVFLEAIDTAPGPSSFHFELRFRPGALHALSVTKGAGQLMLVDTPDWVMSDPVSQPDGTVSFYLLHQAQAQQVFQIDPERTVELNLTNVRADPAGGARASRVEVRYAHLRVGDPASTMLTGTRISYFSIVNRMGRHNLPLHVGFIGGNTVLPGSTTGSELKLRLMNVSPDLSIPWQPGDPAQGIGSFFKISFDLQQDHEQKEWALATLNESRNMTVTAPHSDRGGRWIGTHTGVVKDLQDGTRKAYAFELEQAPPFTLKQNQGVVYVHPPAGATPGEIFATNYWEWPGLPPNQLALAFSLPPQKGSEFSSWATHWQVTPAAQGEFPTWTIWSDEAVDLAPGEYVELTISGIVTSLALGQASLYVDYDGIPGYQPGRFVTIVDKTPISVREDATGIASIALDGRIEAGTSEIYFTDTNHNHSGLGNADGHAAIENATNYNALMILGRTQQSDNRRKIGLWDDAEVHGNFTMNANSWLTIGPWQISVNSHGGLEFTHTTTGRKISFNSAGGMSVNDDPVAFTFIPS